MGGDLPLKNTYNLRCMHKPLRNAKNTIGEISSLGEFPKLPQQGISGYEVAESFGLTHAGRSEGDGDGIMREEGPDCDPAQPHVELLFCLRVDFALGLVEDEKVS